MRSARRSVAVIIVVVAAAGSRPAGQGPQSRAAAGQPSLGTAAATLDYPQWRGRNRDGTASAFNLPASWPERLTRRWQVEIGEGYSSPLVVNGVVYVFSRRNGNETMTALRAESGAVIWQTDYAAPYVPAAPAARHGAGPKATPLFYDGRLYTLGNSGIVSAWDAQTGPRIWQIPAPAEHPLFSTSSSPAADGDIVVTHPGNYGPLTAFDAATGKVRWADKDPGGFSSPMFATLDGVRQVVSVIPGNVIGVSAADGTRLWQHPWGTRATSTGITPIVKGDTIIVSGQGMGVTALKPARKDGAWVADVLWKADEVSMNYSNPVLDGDTLFGMSERSSGQFFALDASSGKVLWLGTPREATNSAVINGTGVIFLLQDDAELVVARPNRTAFEPLKRYSVADSPTWAQPTISGNRILIKDLTTVSLWTP